MRAQKINLLLKQHLLIGSIKITVVVIFFSINLQYRHLGFFFFLTPPPPPVLFEQHISSTNIFASFLRRLMKIMCLLNVLYQISKQRSLEVVCCLILRILFLHVQFILRNLSNHDNCWNIDKTHGRRLFFIQFVYEDQKTKHLRAFLKKSRVICGILRVFTGVLKNNFIFRIGRGPKHCFFKTWVLYRASTYGLIDCNMSL